MDSLPSDEGQVAGALSHQDLERVPVLPSQTPEKTAVLDLQMKSIEDSVYQKTHLLTEGENPIPERN